MANTRILRRRIKSVKNISQITKAMQMVAAVKMRKAQDQAVNGRPYSENLSEALSRLLPRVDISVHPLLGGREIASSKTPRNDKVGVVLLTTDKGLVGALNTNIMRIVLASQMGNVVFYTVGKKGRSFVVRTGKDLAADFENPDLITFREAVQLSKLVTETFLTGEVGEVYLIYPHFVSTLKQEPRRVKLLPVDIESVIANEVKQSHEIASSKTPRNDVGREFLYEPNVDALLDSILIHSVQTRIYQALLETKASEHSSRMVAMKNATDNAKDLVEDLNLTYNQTRQAGITKEILEISTASEAMQ